jgi:hypothetical protein
VFLKEAKSEAQYSWTRFHPSFNKMKITSDFNGIVSRDFVVCFLVSFDRYEVATHKERVHLLSKFRFCVVFFDFHVWA